MRVSDRAVHVSAAHLCWEMVLIVMAEVVAFVVDIVLVACR